MLRELRSSLVLCFAVACGSATLVACAALAQEPLPPAPLPPLAPSAAPVPLATQAEYDDLDSDDMDDSDDEMESGCADTCSSPSCGYALDCADVCGEECEPLCTGSCAECSEDEPLCGDLCGESCREDGPLCTDLCGESCCEEGCVAECGGECTCGECCQSQCRRPCQWYVMAGGGGTIREVAKEEGNGSTFMDFHKGFMLNTALGADLDGLRLELEASFMNNEIERAGADGFNSGSEGNVSLRAYMLNAYYDVKLPGTNCKPYIGAGAGIYQAEFNGVYPGYFDAVGAPLEDNPINATSDTPFAWQVRAGVARQVGCHTEFFTGYRYFKGTELEFASGPFSATGGPIFRQDGAEIHAAEMGFRVRF